MAETVSTIVQVNTTSAQRSIKSLKDEVSRLNSELDNLTIGSDAYNKKVGDLVYTQKELTAAMDSLNGKTTNYIKAFDSISKVGSGLASGVSSISAAFKLLGGDSEALTKSLGKVTTAIQLVQGLQGLKGLGEGITQSVRAFKALTTTMGTTGRAIRALSGPIGIAVAALGGLLVILQNIKENAVQRIRISTEISESYASSSLSEWENDINDQIDRINKDPSLTPAQKRAALDALKSSLSRPEGFNKALRQSQKAAAIYGGVSTSTSKALGNALAGALGIPVAAYSGSKAVVELQKETLARINQGQLANVSDTAVQQILDNIASTSPEIAEIVKGIPKGYERDFLASFYRGSLITEGSSATAQSLRNAGKTAGIVGASLGAATSVGFGLYNYAKSPTLAIRNYDDLLKYFEENPIYQGSYGGSGFSEQQQATKGRTFEALRNINPIIGYAVFGGYDESSVEDAVSQLKDIEDILQHSGKSLKDINKKELDQIVEYGDLTIEQVELIKQIQRLNSQYRAKIVGNVQSLQNFEKSKKTLERKITSTSEGIKDTPKEFQIPESKLTEYALKLYEKQLQRTPIDWSLYSLDVEEETIPTDYTSRASSIQTRIAQNALLNRGVKATPLNTARNRFTGERTNDFWWLYINSLDSARSATIAAEDTYGVTKARNTGLISLLNEQKSLLVDQYAGAEISYDEYKQRELEITQQITDAELEIESAKNEYLNTQLDERIAKQEAYFAAVQSGLQSTGAIFGNVADLMGKKTDDYKAFAYAETVFNTAASAMAAYKAGSEIPVAGVVLGPLAAASAITAGLVQLKNISEEKISSSSSSSSSIPSLTIGGMNYTRNLLGDRETAELNKDTKVYLVTSELEAYQNKVELRDQASSF